MPGFGVSTADAYNWYDERDLSRGVGAREPQHVPGPWPSRAAQMINDLEAPIARHHPEIDQMRTALRRVGALAAAMSGSGSAVFGLFQKRADALAAVDRLSGSGWRVLLTESLDRGEYARRSRPALRRRGGVTSKTPPALYHWPAGGSGDAVRRQPGRCLDLGCERGVLRRNAARDD